MIAGIGPTEFQRSPVFVDHSQKVEWILKLFIRGRRKAAYDQFLSASLYRNVEDSSEEEEVEEKEFSFQIFTDIDNDGGQSAANVFWETTEDKIGNCVGNQEWHYNKLVPISALQGIDTIIVGGTLYLKSK